METPIPGYSYTEIQILTAGWDTSRFDFVWDNGLAQVIPLRWYDDASYCDWQSDNCAD